VQTHTLSESQYDSQVVVPSTNQELLRQHRVPISVKPHVSHKIINTDYYTVRSCITTLPGGFKVSARDDHKVTTIKQLAQDRRSAYKANQLIRQAELNTILKPIEVLIPKYKTEKEYLDSQRVQNLTKERKSHDRAGYTLRVLCKPPSREHINPYLDLLKNPELTHIQRLDAYNNHHRCSHKLRFNDFKIEQQKKLLVPFCDHIVDGRPLEKQASPTNSQCHHCKRKCVYEVYRRGCCCKIYRCLFCKYQEYIYENISLVICHCNFSNIYKTHIRAKPSIVFESRRTTDEFSYASLIRPKQNEYAVTWDRSEYYDISNTILESQIASGHWFYRGLMIPPHIPEYMTLARHIYLGQSFGNSVRTPIVAEAQGDTVSDDGELEFLDHTNQEYQEAMYNLTMKGINTSCPAHIASQCFAHHKDMQLLLGHPMSADYIKARNVSYARALEILDMPLDSPSDKEPSTTVPSARSIFGTAYDLLSSLLKSSVDTIVNTLRSISDSLSNWLIDSIYGSYPVLSKAFNFLVHIRDVCAKFITMIKEKPIQAIALITNVVTAFYSEDTNIPVLILNIVANAHALYGSDSLCMDLASKLGSNIYKAFWISLAKVCSHFVTSSSSVEAQGDADHTASFLLSITNILGFKGSLKSLGNLCRDYNSIYVSAKNLGSFVTQLIEFIPATIKYIFGHKSPAVMLNSKYENPVQHYSACAMTVRLRSELCVSQESYLEARTECKRARQAFYTWVEETAININTREWQLFVRQTEENASRLYRPTGKKKEPFVILLTGPPGVGKSNLVRVIVAALLQCSFEEAEKQTFVRNVNSEYWDRYVGQSCVVYDDFGQHRDELDYAELFSLATTAEFLAPYASVNAADADTTGVKGMTVSPKFLIACSNQVDFKPTTIMCPEAILRRFDFAVKVDYLGLRGSNIAKSSQKDGTLNHYCFQKVDYARNNNGTAEYDTIGTGEVGLTRLLDTIKETYSKKQTVSEVFEANLESFYSGYKSKVEAQSGADDIIYLAVKKLMNASIVAYPISAAAVFITNMLGAEKYYATTLSNIPTWYKILEKSLTSFLSISSMFFTLKAIHTMISRKLPEAQSVSTGQARRQMRPRVIRARGDLAPQEAQAQGQLYDCVLKKIRGNQVVIRCVDYPNAMRALYISGTHILAPSHLFRLNNVDGYVPDGTIYEIACADTAPQIFRFALDALRVITDTRNDEKDLIVYELPRNIFHAHPKIVQYFATDMDLQSQTEIALIKVHKDFSFETGITRIGDIDICYTYDIGMDGQQFSIVHYSMFNYEYPTERGDCGCPIMIRNGLQDGKIIGIHLAGIRARNIGAATVITQQHLYAALNSYNTINPAIAQHETLDTEMTPAEKAKYLQGTIRVLGHVKPGYHVSRSPLVPSGFLEEVCAQFGPPAHCPAMTHSGDPRNVKKTDLMGVDKICHPARGFIPEYMESAFLALRDWYHHKIKRNFRLLTESEAINGIPGSSINALDMTTSAGFPYPVSGDGKRSLFKTNPATGLLEVASPLLRLRIDERMRAWKNGDMYDTIWIDTLKTNECRPVLDPTLMEYDAFNWRELPVKRSRMFAIGPVDYTICARMLFADYISYITDNRFDLPTAVGLNRGSLEWNLMSTKLIQGCSDVGFSLDYEGFDGTVPVEVGDDFADSANEAYADNHTVERCVAVAELYNAVHENDGFLYQTLGSNPSGQPYTTYYNNHGNAFYFLYAWCCVMPTKYKDPTNFRRYCRLVCYGDDCVCMVHPEVQEFFNFRTFKGCMATLGIKVTPADKGDKEYELQHLSEMSFLKSQFQKKGTFWVPVMERKALLNQLYWKSRTLDDHLAFQDNANCVLYSALFFTKQEFLEIRRRLLKIKPDAKLITYEVLWQLFLSNGVIENDENFFGFSRPPLRAYAQGDNKPYAYQNDKDSARVCQTNMSDSVNVSQSNQGVTLVEQNAVQIIPAQDGFTITKTERAQRHLGEKPWTLDDMLSRWNHVADVNWTLTQAVTTVLFTAEVISDLLQNNISSTPFTRFQYWRVGTGGGIKVRFELSASKFYQGRLLVAYFPFQRSKSVMSIPTTGIPLSTCVQVQHAFLDPTNGSVVEFHIPYLHYKDYLDLKSGSDALGYIQVSVLNQLQAVTGGTSSVAFKVNASIVGSEFKIPIPGGTKFSSAVEFESNIIKYAREFEEYLKTHKGVDAALVESIYVKDNRGQYIRTQPREMRKPQRTLSDSDDEIFQHVLPTKAKPIAPRRAQAQGLLEEVGHDLDEIVESFIPNIVDSAVGVLMDNPAIVHPRREVKTTLRQSGNHSRMLTFVDKFTLDPAAQELVSEEHFSTSLVETDLKYLTTRLGLLGTVNWQTTDPVGKELASFWVGPNTEFPEIFPKTGNPIVYATPISQVANMFKHWRGGLKFVLDVVASNYHEGRLDIVYNHGQMKLPATSGATDYNSALSQYSSSLQIRSEKNAGSFLVPFLHETPWCNVWHGEDLKQARSDIGPESFKFTDFFGGTFSIIVGVPLRAPQTVVPQVDINVFLTGASDFQVQGLYGHGVSCITHQLGQTAEAQGDTTTPVAVAPSEPAPAPAALASAGEKKAHEHQKVKPKALPVKHRAPKSQRPVDLNLDMLAEKFTAILGKDRCIVTDPPVPHLSDVCPSLLDILRRQQMIGRLNTASFNVLDGANLPHYHYAVLSFELMGQFGGYFQRFANWYRNFRGAMNFKIDMHCIDETFYSADASDFKVYLLPFLTPALRVKEMLTALYDGLLASDTFLPSGYPIALPISYASRGQVLEFQVPFTDIYPTDLITQNYESQSSYDNMFFPNFTLVVVAKSLADSEYSGEVYASLSDEARLGTFIGMPPVAVYRVGALNPLQAVFPDSWRFSATASAFNPTSRSK